MPGWADANQRQSGLVAPGVLIRGIAAIRPAPETGIADPGNQGQIPSRDSNNCRANHYSVKVPRWGSISPFTR